MESKIENTLVQGEENSDKGQDPAVTNVTASLKPESEVKDDTKADLDRQVLFKKPQLGLIIGPRRGKIPGKLRNLESVSEVKTQEVNISITAPISALGLEDNVRDAASTLISDDSESKNELFSKSSPERKSIKTTLSPAQQLAENVPIPYKEPKWGGCPSTMYKFEVLKSGKILEHLSLNTKSFFVIGRLVNCDINMAHPTISRHHAVIQYRSEGSEQHPSGFYVYDLGSTHGTFLNKNRIKPNLYVRLHVGHILKFGCSTRLFVLQGPSEDEEEESELSVTQIQDLRKTEILRRIQQGQTEEEEGGGVDWGMGEDADEETDLSVNPFAATHNEELYLDDPKKTLRGWFEREGLELEYDVQERGVAQFLCKVELPVESARGGVVVAEAVVQGKKKEAVVQCALEACRILDRYGLLRQATHESKKRKARDWASEDFYDSDDDNFLDRTGAVEQKRQARMRAAGRREVLTYQTLLEQHKKVSAELKDAEDKLRKATTKRGADDAADRGDVDELDAFMDNLETGVTDKLLISKLKSSVSSLKTEEARLRKLVNVARPADLPELKPRVAENAPAAERTTASKMTAIFGKARRRIRSKHADSSRLRVEASRPDGGREADGEEVEDEDDVVEGTAGPVGGTGNSSRRRIEASRPDAGREADGEEVEDEDDVVEETAGPVGATGKDDRTEASESANREETSRSKSSDVEMVPASVVRDEADPDSTTKGLTEREVERRKRRNRKRTMHRNAKMSREENAKWETMDKADPSLYSDWVPPENQSGDGRTSLNERLGY